MQRYLLAVVTPVLVLGAISCWPSAGENTRRGCARRTGRLNNYLYLSSAVLVCGLLFLSALMRWPGYSLHPVDVPSFTANVDGLVFYWSVIYSIFIASYYVPVAAAISSSCPKGSAPAGGTSNADDDEPVAASPFSLLKLGAGIFAPAIVGLLGEVIKV